MLTDRTGEGLFENHRGELDEVGSLRLSHGMGHDRVATLHRCKELLGKLWAILDHAANEVEGVNDDILIAAAVHLYADVLEFEGKRLVGVPGAERDVLVRAARAGVHPTPVDVVRQEL